MSKGGGKEADGAAGGAAGGVADGATGRKGGGKGKGGKGGDGIVEDPDVVFKELRSQCFLLLRSRQQELMRQQARAPPFHVWQVYSFPCMAGVLLSMYGRCAPSAPSPFPFMAGVLPLLRALSLLWQVCSLCSEPLLTPTRIQSCRHVLCTKCVDVTVSYFRECPTCAATLEGSDVINDTTHGRLLSLRYATLKMEPLALTQVCLPPPQAL